MKKTLIVYYSHSGNTKNIAKLIQEETQGTLAEIRSLNPYPISYNEVVDQAKKEISKGFMPEIEELNIDMSEYDTIFIGTPNWWSTIAPPIKTFLSKYNLSGKKAAIFCTHGGSGIAHIAKDIKTIISDSIIIGNFDIYNNGGKCAKKSVSDWINKLNI